MSQAEELLDSMTEEEMVLYSADPTDEPHIVVGSDRCIIVPDMLKRIAVQHDHNVETVTFDCPRYWDGLNMSDMAVYINYVRSDNYEDCYPVSTVTVDEDNPNIMHFEWIISRNVTGAAGAISFSVCIKKVDDEGNEVNHWNSEVCNDMSVSKGLETIQQVLEDTPDLVYQLRLETVERVEDDMAEVLASLNGYAESLIGGDS